MCTLCTYVLRYGKEKGTAGLTLAGSLRLLLVKCGQVGEFGNAGHPCAEGFNLFFLLFSYLILLINLILSVGMTTPRLCNSTLLFVVGRHRK